MTGYKQALRIITAHCDFAINERSAVNPIQQLFVMEERDKLHVIRRHESGDEIDITIRGEYVIYWAKGCRYEQDMETCRT